MTRSDRIHHALATMEARERISSYYCYAPGDGAKRWVVEHYGATSLGGTTSFTTREVESFIAGYEVGCR